MAEAAAAAAVAEATTAAYGGERVAAWVGEKMAAEGARLAAGAKAAEEARLAGAKLKAKTLALHEFLQGPLSQLG